MTDFGLQNLDHVTVTVGEGDADCRAGIVAALERLGLRNIRAHGTRSAFLDDTAVADIVILGDNIDLAPWSFLRDLRHNRLAANPFAIIACIVGQGRRADAQDAIGAGADDVFSRPFNDQQFVQRLRRLIVQRPSFVVTSDYVGPDRRARDRGAAIGRFVAPHPVLEKGSGAGGFAPRTAAVRELLQARLDAHGYRLGFLCRIAAEHPEKALIIQEAVADLLADATASARLLGEPVDALLCRILAQMLADSTPAESPEVLAKICRTAVPCLRANVPWTAQAEALAAGAATYLSRARLAFAAPLGIYLPGSSAEQVTCSGADIREYAKGAVLVRQDEAFTLHHIIAAGSVALYRRRQGQQVPVARVRKGEALGEGAEFESHRLTAIAAEPTVTLVFARDDLRKRLAAAHPDVVRYLAILGSSTSRLHELYTPRSRHVSDSIQQMSEQVAAIRDYVASPTAPAGLKTEAVAIAERLEILTAELIATIADQPELDRRSRVMPDAEDMGLGEPSPDGPG